MKIKRGLNSKTFSKSQSFQSYAEDTLILPPSLRENLNFIEYVGRRVSEHGGVTGQMSTPAPSYWGTGTTWTSWPPCSRASSAGPRATTNGPARWGRRWSKYAWNYCLKKKIVIAEEDNFFKQRMTSSSANSIFFKQKMFDNLECDRFVLMRKIHNAKSWVRKVNFKLSVNLLNIEYQSLVFDIEEQIETIFW